MEVSRVSTRAGRALIRAGKGGRALGVYQAGQPVGFIMAVLGAVVVLTIYRVGFSGRHRSV